MSDLGKIVDSRSTILSRKRGLTAILKALVCKKFCAGRYATPPGLRLGARHPEAPNAILHLELDS